MFLGRENELRILREKLSNDTYEFGVVFGQRRIGKTSLILEAVNDADFIYFLAREDTLQNNLAYFTSEVVKALRLPFQPAFKSFDELFDALDAQIGDRRFAIVIDEYPFLCKAYPGFVSYFQSLVDRVKREQKPRKFILSGSDTSFMVDLLENKAKPLYQRATFRMHVRPMIFSDAVKMLHGFSGEDQIRYLSVFGNRPYYLDKLDKAKSFRENIVSLCFSDSSILIDAPNITLPIGFGNNSVYVSILGAISGHKQKAREIADAVGIDSNAVSTYLGRMTEGEALERRDTFNGNKKTNYYEISDPFIRFYYRLVYPNLALIERKLGDEVFDMNQSIIEDIVDHGFEDAAISYLDELNANRKLPCVCYPFKRYRVDNSKLGRSIEIDALAESIDERELVVVEAKYRNKDVSKEILDHLKESASIFAPNYDKVHYILFSKSSFTRDLATLNDPEVTLISLKDMVSE